MKRQEFNDAKKSAIYVRDKALCAFSGKSLWILEHGVSPTYEIDWVDHIKPASRGGDNSIDNGVCSSYFYNSKKRANSNDNKYLFFAGKPTEYFYYFYEKVPKHIFQHLQQFKNIEESDWYLNRAIFRFILGVDRILESQSGRSYVRNESYYAKSSLKILNQWKKKSLNNCSVEDRGLVDNSISLDQKALLSIRNCDLESDILDLMHDSLRWYEANTNAIEKLSKAKTTGDFKKLNRYVKNNINVTNRIRAMINHNVSGLSALLPNENH